MSARPSVLFYCQHSVGLGHLVRSLALVDGLCRHFDVTLLNGGRLPAGVAVPDGVRLVNLPPLGQPGSELVSHDPSLTPDEALARRRDMLIAALDDRPAAIIVELFPFGRKKFAPELVPFLEAVHAAGPEQPKVLCSVRDLLVGDRPDQASHDDRASRLCNAYFDAVLVHADPRFARLEETFRPRTPLTVPVIYTGFVTSADEDDGVTERRHRVLVSAGGGMVGDVLLRTAVEAYPHVRDMTGAGMTIVTGPFAPETTLEHLVREAHGTPGLEVVRQVPDLLREMRASAASLSQCGYNTSMDIVRAGVRALVVPYAEHRDTEQSDRARRLAAAGIVRVVPQAELTGARLAQELVGLMEGTWGPRLALDLDGRDTCGRIVRELVDGNSASTLDCGNPVAETTGSRT